MPATPSCASSCFSCSRVLGQWQRALTQLQVCGELDAGTLAMVNTYRQAVQCEAVREAVFAGKTTPHVFGQPQAWVAWLAEALAADAPWRRRRGRREAARAGARSRAGHCRQRSTASLRLDRRWRLAPRPGARSHHQRPLLLGAVRRAGQGERRSADRSARHGLVGRAARVHQRRADGGAAAHALRRLRAKQRRRAATGAPHRVDGARAAISSAAWASACWRPTRRSWACSRCARSCWHIDCCGRGATDAA